MRKIYILLIVFFVFSGCTIETVSELPKERIENQYSNDINFGTVGHCYHSNFIRRYSGNWAPSVATIKRETGKLKLIKINDKYSYSKHKINDRLDVNIFFVYMIRERDEVSLILYSYFTFENKKTTDFISSLQEGQSFSLKSAKKMNLPIIKKYKERMMDVLINGKIRYVNLLKKDKKYIVQYIEDVLNEPNAERVERAERYQIGFSLGELDYYIH